MNFKDPESMNIIIGSVLRYGVILSAAVTVAGIALVLAENGATDTAAYLTYNPGSVPHGVFPVGFPELVGGLSALNAYSLIDLGVILLVATPVSRVAISVLLFAAERDELYVAVTAVVLVLLLFSMLVTPFIPGFHA